MTMMNDLSEKRIYSFRHQQKQNLATNLEEANTELEMWSKLELDKMWEEIHSFEVRLVFQMREKSLAVKCLWKDLIKMMDTLLDFDRLELQYFEQ